MPGAFSLQFTFAIFQCTLTFYRCIFQANNSNETQWAHAIWRKYCCVDTMAEITHKKNHIDRHDNKLINSFIHSLSVHIIACILLLNGTPTQSSPIHFIDEQSFPPHLYDSLDDVCVRKCAAISIQLTYSNRIYQLKCCKRWNNKCKNARMKMTLNKWLYLWRFNRS